MALEAICRSETDIPEALREFYVERTAVDGKTKQWELTGNGVKTQADIDRLNESLRKEREDHRKAKDALSTWNAFGVKPDEIQAKLDKFDELELAVNNAGKLDDDKINQIVESRIKTRLAPVERAKAELEGRLNEATNKIASYQQSERQRTIHDAVRKARIAAKVIDTAEEDALYLAERMFDVDEQGRVTTKDGVGVTPGVEPDVWLTEMQAKRPHWWPESNGGGARGSRNGGGMQSNPWSKNAWNVTAQMAYVTQYGEEKARQMAEMVGSSLGAIAPAK